MKKVVIYFMVLMSSLVVSAQEITVKGFEELPNDLSARTKEMKDANGEACALIKVVIPKQDVTFEGWVIDQQYTPGEYWVYMPEGTPKVKIKHKELTPLQFEFPEKLIGKHTYTMVLEIKEDSRHYAYFRVKANVKDCELYIHNEKYTTSKGQFEVKLPDGSYDYTLIATKDCYKPIKGNVTIEETDTYKKLNCVFKYTDEYLAAKEQKKEKRKKVWGTIGAIGLGAAAIAVGSQK